MVPVGGVTSAVPPSWGPASGPPSEPARQAPAIQTAPPVQSGTQLLSGITQTAGDAAVSQTLPGLQSLLDVQVPRWTCLQPSVAQSAARTRVRAGRVVMAL